jgi:hypothetical protein
LCSATTVATVATVVAVTISVADTCRKFGVGGMALGWPPWIRQGLALTMPAGHLS